MNAETRHDRSTRVVHCRHEPYDVYIGRGRDPRSGEPGCWGNPFRIGPDGSREEVIARYAEWLRGEVDAERISLEELAALDGKTLACWCAPRPCHGEVLVRASAWAARMLAGPPNIFWELRTSRRGGRLEPLVR
jgi:hypothetical protein